MGKKKQQEEPPKEPKQAEQSQNDTPKESTDSTAPEGYELVYGVRRKVRR